MLKEHKGINLPGVAVSAPALTEKDRDDLRFGVLHNVDSVALSFVRKPEDVVEAKQLIKQYHAELNIGKLMQISIPLIAKLEKPEAVARLDEILDVVKYAPHAIVTWRVIRPCSKKHFQSIKKLGTVSLKENVFMLPNKRPF